MLRNQFFRISPSSPLYVEQVSVTMTFLEDPYVMAKVHCICAQISKKVFFCSHCGVLHQANQVLVLTIYMKSEGHMGIGHHSNGYLGEMLKFCRTCIWRPFNFHDNKLASP